jgi:tetratricopeptide (TPR) repeat protein
VHAAIPVAAASEPATVGQLPTYIIRDHDVKLRSLLVSAAGSRPLIQMLVGSSSVGKSRAAYEAVVACLPTWHVFRPLTADRLCRAIEQHVIGPQTVIWLDDARTIFDGESGQRAAAGLLDLMDEGSEHPNSVVMLGSMWTQHWTQYRDREMAPQTARLLSPDSLVAVSATFDDADEREIEAAKRSDARIQEAAESQGDHGELAQYLAGGVLLSEYYETAFEGRRALLDAALDAYQVGFHSPIPTSFLLKAAQDYLPPGLRKHWSVKRLQEEIYAAERLMPVGALIRRHQEADVTNEAHYFLADYLAQRAEGTSRPVNAAIWEHLQTVAVEEWDRNRIAITAYCSGFWRLATIFWMRDSAGQDRALSSYAWGKIKVMSPRSFGGSDATEERWMASRSYSLLSTMVFTAAIMLLEIGLVFHNRSLLAVMTGCVIIIYLLLYFISPTCWFSAIILRYPEAMLARAQAAEQAGDIGRGINWRSRCYSRFDRSSCQPRNASRAVQVARAATGVVPASDSRTKMLTEFLKISSQLGKAGGIGDVGKLWPPYLPVHDLQIFGNGANFPMSQSWLPQSPPLALMRGGYTREAIDWLKEAYETHQDVTTLRGLVELLLRVDESDNALAYLRRSDSLYAINRSIADMIISQERFEDATDWLLGVEDNAGKHQRNVAEVIIMIANAQLRAGSLDRAESLLRAYMQPPRADRRTVDSTHDVRLRLAVLLTDHGRALEARDLYEELLSDAPRDHEGPLTSSDDRHAAALAEYGSYLAYYKNSNKILTLYGVTGAEIRDRVTQGDIEFRLGVPYALKYLLAASGESELALGLCYGAAERARIWEITRGPQEAIKLLNDYLAFAGRQGPRGDAFTALWSIRCRMGEFESAGQIYAYMLEPTGAPAAPWHWASHADGLFTGAEFDLTPELLYAIRTDASA